MEPDVIKAMLATQFDSFHKGKIESKSGKAAYFDSTSGPVFIHQMQSLLGLGIFNSDGTRINSCEWKNPNWKYRRNVEVSNKERCYAHCLQPKSRFHRAMTRPFFSKDRISHFDIFDRHAESALSLLKERLRQGYPVDIQVHQYKW